ncbi:MAG: N-acetyltransferase family protein [Litorimonas sp.]
MIRDAGPGDAVEIAEIYNHYVINTVVTFEEDPIDANEIKSRIATAKTGALPYIIYESEGDGVIGYAYASKWKGRCAYRYSVEVSVYLAHGKTGHGTGSKLYAELFGRLSSLGYHVAIGGISLPNPASIALHEKFGMTKTAHFSEIGFKFGKWVDVGYWQGILPAKS